MCCRWSSAGDTISINADAASDDESAEMNWEERIQNTALGLNFVAWGLWPFLFGTTQPLTTTRLSVACINLLVGGLFVFRQTQRGGAALRSLLICLPSIVLYAVVFQTASPTDDWPIYANLGVAIGAGFTMLAFLYLGRSFAIFPAIREVAANGPYQLVRHPAYLGELIILVACWSARPSWLISGLFAVTLLALVLRIYDEEQLLMNSKPYQRYAAAVRWRLIPRVW